MSKHEKIRIFNNAIAIITGGASGIGKEFGIELAKRGCEVVLADLQIDLAEEAANEIRKNGGKATAVELDVVEYESVEEIVQQTYKRCGRIDYVFNNAGIGISGEMHDFEISDWNKTIDVNLRGVVHGVQAAFPVMRKQGFGHIVNTASIAGVIPWPMGIPYTTTKHAVVGLSCTLRAESAGTGVRVSVLCPGALNTPLLGFGGKHGGRIGWFEDYPEDKLKKFLKYTRPYEPDMYAKKSLNQIARNKAIILFPFRYKLMWSIYRFSPVLGIGVARMTNYMMRLALEKLRKE